MRGVQPNHRAGLGLLLSATLWLAMMAPQAVVATPAARTSLPRPDHVVIVIEENHAYSEIIGNPDAPYINSLAHRGALFAQSFAVGHPSEPNYLALFSGSTQGITDDSCPHSFAGANLASELLGHGLSFGIYSESMPSVGYTGCRAGSYYRKHNPAVNWQGVNVPMPANVPFALFTIVPGDYDQLPTVSFVVPNEDNDMHDGSIRQGDQWLKKHLADYVQWAQFHNSLLIVTWDEDDDSGNNRIPTIFIGPMVKPGIYDTRIDHYDVLRTIADMYGLGHPGKSAEAAPIAGVWLSTSGEGAAPMAQH